MYIKKLKKKNKTYRCLCGVSFIGAECYDIAGEEFRCGKCPPGFTGNGVSCNRIFLCKDNPCYPGRYKYFIYIFYYFMLLQNFLPS